VLFLTSYLLDVVQIKHPGVIKVIETLEETNGQMVFVTEPIFGSLANMLTQFRDVPSTPEERSGAVLSPLEIKYGLNHIADTLHFLHQEARLAHCNLNPGSVFVTRDGGWKLAGFEFAGGIAEFGGPSGAAVAFEYTSAHPSPWEEYCAVSGVCAASREICACGVGQLVCAQQCTACLGIVLTCFAAMQ
jgi:serine/threonine protein kinase